MLLLVVFRSVLVPLKAAVMNLLSVGAAYGVLVMVFQWGWGADLIGLESTVPILSFIPLFMFAILFGLSMDYEVFLLSRMREEYLRTGDNDEAVVRGLAGTGRTITSAALIMVAVFGGFVLGEDPLTKMMGLGLATAIAVDATIVRLVLVPATMKLLGDGELVAARVARPAPARRSSRTSRHLLRSGLPVLSWRRRRRAGDGGGLELGLGRGLRRRFLALDRDVRQDPVQPARQPPGGLARTATSTAGASVTTRMPGEQHGDRQADAELFDRRIAVEDEAREHRRHDQRGRGGDPGAGRQRRLHRLARLLAVDGGAAGCG